MTLGNHPDGNNELPNDETNRLINSYCIFSLAQYFYENGLDEKYCNSVATEVYADLTFSKLNHEQFIDKWKHFQPLCSIDVYNVLNQGVQKILSDPSIISEEFIQSVKNQQKSEIDRGRDEDSIVQNVAEPQHLQYNTHETNNSIINSTANNVEEKSESQYNNLSNKTYYGTERQKMHSINTKPINHNQKYPKNIANFQTPNQQKIQKRCNQFPNCVLGDKCKFVHPDTMCKFWPKCSYGLNCLYIHPEIDCKYGLNCTNLQCNYVHPPDWNPGLINKKFNIKKGIFNNTTYHPQN